MSPCFHQPSRRAWLRLAAAAMVLPAFAPARAQGAGPLTVVIPFAPGGASDLVVRALADGVGAELGRTVLIENKGGAGGLLAAGAVGRSAADGATLLYGNQGQMVVARHLLPGNTVQPLELLVPLVLTARTSFVLVVPADSPFTRAADVAAALKSRPLRFGIPGIGTPPHLATVLLGEATGSTPELVPYQGSGPLLVDLAASRLDIAFDNIASSLPHVRSGRLRALGVSSATRSAAAPDLPTLAEAGLGGFAYQAWQGVFAPAGTPPEMQARLEGALLRALRAEAARQRLESMGLELASLGREAFAALIARDAAYWEALVRKGTLKPQ